MIRFITSIIFILFSGSVLCQDKELNIGHGTLILTVLTKDTVVIAADTKYQFTDLDTKNNEVSILDKIKYKEGVYYAFGGEVSIYNTKTNEEIFNSYQILKSILYKHIKFASIFPLLDSAIRSEIYSFSINKDLTNGFNELLNKPLFLGFVITSFINKKTIYKAGSYTFTGNNTENYKLHYTDNTQKMPYLDRSGSYEYVDNFLEKHLGYLADTPLIKIDSKLIQLMNVQASKDSTVGFPVDIFKITAKGIFSKKRYYSGNKK